jgi:hypothetical protein
MAIERNADRNTPTIAQLKPDVIIFAGLWNDVWRVVKYAGWGIPPNPDEVNRNGGVPASVDYLRAVFDYADEPTEENLRAANERFARAMRPLDAATLARLNFADYATLKESADFAILAENAGEKLRFLAGEFVRRARRDADVWTLTLPGRFGDSYEAASKKLVSAGLLPAQDTNKS